MALSLGSWNLAGRSGRLAGSRILDKIIGSRIKAGRDTSAVIKSPESTTDPRCSLIKIIGYTAFEYNTQQIVLSP